MDLKARVDVNFKWKDRQMDGRTDGKPDAYVVPCLSKCDKNMLSSGINVFYFIYLQCMLHVIAECVHFGV